MKKKTDKEIAAELMKKAYPKWEGTVMLYNVQGFKGLVLIDMEAIFKVFLKGVEQARKAEEIKKLSSDT